MTISRTPNKVIWLRHLCSEQTAVRPKLVGIVRSLLLRPTQAELPATLVDDVDPARRGVAPQRDLDSRLRPWLS